MPIDQWWNFFYLCGSASATLTGLTFVAITLGATLIKKETLDQIDVYITPFCFHFLHIFFLCCVTAIPNVDPRLLGGAAIVSAVWRAMSLPKSHKVIRVNAQKPDSEIDSWDWVTVIYVPAIIYVAFIAAGVGLFLFMPWAIWVLATSCLALLLASAKGTWDSLVWIAATIK